MNISRKIFIGLIALLSVVPISAEAKKTAAKKQSAEQLLQEACTAFYDYDPELAQTKINEARKARNVDTDKADSIEVRVKRMNEMIQRVEDIVIIDSVNVKRDEFLSVYRLSPTVGSLTDAGDLEGQFNAADPTAVYTSEDGKTMIWGTPEGLAESHRLTSGERETPVLLDDVLNAGGVANFPFMLPDGITLYYATEGDDSLGGLDLYISRRNRDGFSVPQNMGMPYNSPYNDYMLAIDEDTGAGWFASDRTQIADTVTVYIFIPAETRVNLDINTPDLGERARISSIAATQRADEDYSAILAKINAIAPSAGSSDNTPDFEFALPDGRILTRWEDFRSDQARQIMENYVDALADYEADKEQLATLREKYAAGETHQSDRILTLEKKLKSERSTLQKIANRIIVCETSI